jgi:hypothetical protein
VILALPGPPVAVPVRPHAPTWAAFAHVAGWVGKVVPEPAQGPGGAERAALRFTGIGVVLCHDLGVEGGRPR